VASHVRREIISDTRVVSLESVLTPVCGQAALVGFSTFLHSNVKHLIVSPRIKIAPFLSRRTQHWQEKSHEIDEFPLLCIKSMCYLTLRLVVNRSGGVFSRLGNGGEPPHVGAVGPEIYSIGPALGGDVKLLLKLYFVTYMCFQRSFLDT
jgi:hypothetical protein